jgi:hypothetical protein
VNEKRLRRADLRHCCLPRASTARLEAAVVSPDHCDLCAPLSLF